MSRYVTKAEELEVSTTAPDGSEVRLKFARGKLDVKDELADERARAFADEKGHPVEHDKKNPREE